MAQRVQIIRTDDIDGTESSDINTVRFGLDNAQYEIDLSPENQQRLFEALDPFIQKARKYSPNKGAGKTARKSTGTGLNAKVRAWAKENGIEVNDRGRVASELVERYQAATGND